MNYFILNAFIEKDEPAGYHGFVPSLKGLHTCGKTISETKENLKEAIICHIQGLIKDSNLNILNKK